MVSKVKNMIVLRLIAEGEVFGKKVTFLAAVGNYFTMSSSSGVFLTSVGPAEASTSIFDAQTYVPVKATSLTSFLTAVNELWGANIPVSTELEVGLLDDLTQYFDNVIRDSKACAYHPEDWLMRDCFHPLLVYGDCVMEDTSESVRNMSAGIFTEQQYSPSKEAVRKRKREQQDTVPPAEKKQVMVFAKDEDAEKIRAIAFKRIPTNGRKPDYTIRRRCAGEREGEEEVQRVKIPLQYKLETRCREPLPTERFIPYNVVSFVEIKKMCETLNTGYIKQVAFYSQSHLRVTPGRRFFVSALTNLKGVVFVVAVATPNEDGNVRYMCFSSDIIYQDDAFLAAQLAEFCARSPVSQGCTEHGFPFHALRPRKVLGRGSTSCVFQCTSITAVARSAVEEPEPPADERVVAVKVSRLSHAIAMEKWVLQRLASDNTKNSLPSLDLTFLAEHTVQEPYRDCILVFDRIYQPMNDTQWRNDPELLNDVWAVLQHAHSRGIVHRDVRPANCMWDEANKCVVVVDWSSASCFTAQPSTPPPQRVRGCATTASQRVLVQFMRSEDSHYQVFPVDEAQSMLYFACFALKDGLEKRVVDLRNDILYARMAVIINEFRNFPELIKGLEDLVDDESPHLISNVVLHALNVLCDTCGLN